MCGITGILAFNQVGGFYMINLGKSIDALSKRGPDARGSFVDDMVALGHRRLSIIDTSYNGKQPMSDETGRYTIVFNGEIFNYKTLKSELEASGSTFSSDSDTEVLLKLYIKYGKNALDKLIGFFAFAVYDKQDESLFVARDRMGIKPLLYYQDEDKFIFASEMKALMSYNIPKALDYTSLYQYLHFNYIPSPDTIFKNVRKLEPGHYLYIKKREVRKEKYFGIEKAGDIPFAGKDYQDYKNRLVELLDESVQLRMVSDVPLGAFLSGGIDSSVIVGLASKYTDKLNTFSIGYKDEPFFDETKYANLVAKKFNTEHTVFSLGNDDLLEHVQDVLDYLDEPFADSSAIAVYILSKQTRQKVTVALSGDGADELFGGYNKHMAEFRALSGGNINDFVKFIHPLVSKLPQSRNSFFSNKIRQINRFGEGLNLNAQERYYKWAGFAGEENAKALLSESTKENIIQEDYIKRKQFILRNIKENSSLRDVLLTDTELVLVSDMLFKVDMMSMANGLEVRVPFLDHRVVEFAFSLPDSFKVDKGIKKKIVQDAFRDMLPSELYKRPKHGFEVPLLKWFRKDLKNVILNDLLEDGFIKEQDIFDVQEIRKLKKQLFSSNPGDVHARIWGLIVFQFWYKKFFS